MKDNKDEVHPKLMPFHKKAKKKGWKTGEHLFKYLDETEMMQYDNITEKIIIQKTRHECDMNVDRCSRHNLPIVFCGECIHEFRHETEDRITEDVKTMPMRMSTTDLQCWVRIDDVIKLIGGKEREGNEALRKAKEGIWSFDDASFNEVKKQIRGDERTRITEKVKKWLNTYCPHGYYHDSMCLKCVKELIKIIGGKK